MAGTFDWGVQLILWLQRLSPALDWPFRALTFLGEAEFFLILLPLLYWRPCGGSGARLTRMGLWGALSARPGSSCASNWRQAAGRPSSALRPGLREHAPA
jgi:hypothetical protein